MEDSDDDDESMFEDLRCDVCHLGFNNRRSLRVHQHTPNTFMTATNASDLSWRRRTLDIIVVVTSSKRVESLGRNSWRAIERLVNKRPRTFTPFSYQPTLLSLRHPLHHHPHHLRLPYQSDMVSKWEESCRATI